MSSSRWSATLRLLQSGNFARYMTARLGMNFGWQMLEVAVGWQIYALTRDPLSLGLVGLWEFLPFVTLVLVGGHVADHFNRRSILFCAAVGECLCALALVWFVISGVTRPWPVYAAVAIHGTTRAFWSPAIQAFLINIVPREEFAASAAMDSLLRQFSVVGGPALGGLLYLAGAQVVFAACASLFLVAAVTILTMRVALPAALRSNQPLAQRSHELLEGLRYVFHNRVVLACISLDLFAVLFGGAVALLPVYAADILRIGPVGLGVLRSAPAAGAAMVGMMLAMRPLRDHAGSWMFGGVAAFGVATVVFGLSRNFWLSLAALVLTGAGDMISVYVRTVLVQISTPETIRGRVSAVNSMFIGASNELGAFESGAVARLIGVVPSVVAGGVATLLVVAAWRQWFPQMRRLPALR